MADKPMHNRMLEASIKCALIDRLRDKGVLDADAVLVNEFVVDGWANRADLVVANGKTLAFEIKSAADRLDRLPAQLTAFQRFFDKVIAVVDVRHLVAAKTIVPDGVGLWSLRSDDNGIYFQVENPGRRRDVTDKNALIRMLNVNELRSLLQRRGNENCRRDRRSALEEKARALSVQALRAGVLKALKQRYAESDSAFRAAVGNGPTSLEALALLRRHRLENENTSDAADGWKFLLTPELSRVEDPIKEWGRELKNAFGPVPRDVLKKITISR